MIAIPAVDLREGACVQLVGGRTMQERVRLADPVDVARDWARSGFRACTSSISTLRRDAGPTDSWSRRCCATGQRASGRRRRAGADAIERLLDQGADRVVVGTRALEDATGSPAGVALP